MAGATAPENRLRNESVFLRDNPPSARWERVKRRVQIGETWVTLTLNQDWASELNINSQSATTSQYFLTGTQPVIITEPAIVIQPNGGELKRGDH